jgi:hypothetical protein
MDATVTHACSAWPLTFAHEIDCAPFHSPDARFLSPTMSSRPQTSSRSATAPPTQRSLFSTGWRNVALASALFIGGSMIVGLIKRRFRLQQLAREAVQLPQRTRYFQERIQMPFHSYQDFLECVQKVKQQVPADQPWYAYVGAANNAEGVPWCGDCRRGQLARNAAATVALER